MKCRVSFLVELGHEVFDGDGVVLAGHSVHHLRLGQGIDEGPVNGVARSCRDAAALPRFLQIFDNFSHLGL